MTTTDATADSTSSELIDVTPTKDKGVLKEIIREGIGDEYALPGDTVTVHYVGTLYDDGSLFDSSRNRNEKFEFTLGTGEVIKAWDLGVATMKKGELCKLICKSDYAYGKRGSPPKIPPDACLVFEVELFDWRGEDLSLKKNGGIMRRILQNGKGQSSPKDGAMVKVSLVGKVNGSVFDERELTFPVGEGIEHNIPKGIERALRRFKKDEKSVIKLIPKYAFGPEGSSELGVPPDTDVEYEVHLKDFENSKEYWQMDQEEVLEQAKIAKQKGTDYFKQEKYQLAINQYKKMTSHLRSNPTNQMKEEYDALLLAAHLNLAICYLKVNNNNAARDNAIEALKLDPVNVKARFRMGQALLNMSDAEEAKKQFEKCLELEKENKAVAHQLMLCNRRIKEQKAREKELFGGMFDKFAKVDAKAAASKSRNDVMSGDIIEWEVDEDEDEDEEEDLKYEKLFSVGGFF